jgi:hypothetical protein
VPAAADCVAGHPEQGQDRAGYHDNDADSPEDGDFRDEADNEEDYAENDQGDLLDLVVLTTDDDFIEVAT